MAIIGFGISVCIFIILLIVICRIWPHPKDPEKKIDDNS